MGTHTVHSIRGSTASSALPGPRDPTGAPDADRPRRGLGSLLRAAGVYLDTAFRVVVLGTDGTAHPSGREPEIPRQSSVHR